MLHRILSQRGALLACYSVCCCAALAGRLGAQDASEPGWYRSLLRSALIVMESREAAALKAHVRKQAQQHWGHEAPSYGLDVLDRLDAAQRVVVFVHGCNSRPEALQHLVQLTRGKGHAAAVFRYPNDESLEDSSRRFASALDDFRRRHAGSSLIVVTHSMGALVARRVIEDDQFGPHQVSRLIMIAPPNHGSALARIARGVDLVEYALSKTRRRESGLLSGSILDGLAGAMLDLRPNSAFLRHLNSRARNPDVQYTIVAGSGAPFHADELRLAQSWLNRVARKSTFARATLEELRVRVDELDELVRGRGDGAVALDSTRLAGLPGERTALEARPRH